MFKRRSKLKTTPNLQVLNGGKEAPPTPPPAAPPLLEAQRVEGEENLHEMAKETLKNLRISQAQMARELGISPTTLSQWISGKYTAANKKVDEAAREWIDKNVRQTAFLSAKTQGFVQTNIAERVENTLAYAHLLGDLAITTPPRPRRWQGIRLVPFHGVKGTCSLAGGGGGGRGSAPQTLVFQLNRLFKNVLFALAPHERVGGKGGDVIFRMIVQRLQGTKGLLIIDEAQHLSLLALESLRSIHDATACGLVLMGNESVYANLSGRRSAEFAQLFSRVGMVLQLRKTTAADVEALAGHWGGKKNPAARYDSAG